MILPILTYPDPRLHTIAQEVKTIDERIQTLAHDMLQTMYSANGIGLAATQVNVHLRMVVIDVSEARNEPLVLINPQILQYSQQWSVGEEGCLSVPQIYDNVERAESVSIQYQDLQGNVQPLQASGLLAVCIQHELDHLQGKVFVQYLSPLKRERIKTKLLKNRKNVSKKSADKL